MMSKRTTVAATTAEASLFFLGGGSPKYRSLMGGPHKKKDSGSLVSRLGSPHFGKLEFSRHSWHRTKLFKL